MGFLSYVWQELNTTVQNEIPVSDMVSRNLPTAVKQELSCSVLTHPETVGW